MILPKMYGIVKDKDFNDLSEKTEDRLNEINNKLKEMEKNINLVLGDIHIRLKELEDDS